MKTLFYIFILILPGAFSVFGQNRNAIFYQQLEWSPDGQILSLTAMTDYNPKTDGYRSGIYLIRPDGSKRRKISADEKKTYYSSWSKDGQRLAFSVDLEGGTDSDIFTARKDGTDLVQLTKTSGRNATPAYSPDGKKIAFMSTRDGDKYQIYVMNAKNGSDVKRLTDDSSLSFCNPMWSPDGKRIVYYSDNGNRRDQIWIMNADGTGQTLLTGGLGHNIFPSFSPDGKRIIFSSSNRDGGNASYVDGSFLYIMNADGSNLKPLSDIKSFFARFSPDGKRIAFIAGKFPESAVYLADSDGSKIVKVS